jgi:hypothetical protein
MSLMEAIEADEAAAGSLDHGKEVDHSGNGEFVAVHDGVFDLLAQAADWADILVPAGWTEAKPADSSTLQAWKRPDGTYDISAKVLKVQPNVLVVHSDAAGLPNGGGRNSPKPVSMRG